MNQWQAYRAMQQGHLVVHEHFTSDEYLRMIHGKIVAEDGVDFTRWFWENPIYKGDKWSVLTDVEVSEGQPILNWGGKVVNLTQGSPDFISKHRDMHDIKTTLDDLLSSADTQQRVVFDSLGAYHWWQTHRYHIKKQTGPNLHRAHKRYKTRKRQQKASRKRNR